MWWGRTPTFTQNVLPHLLPCGFSIWPPSTQVLALLSLAAPILSRLFAPRRPLNCQGKQKVARCFREVRVAAAAPSQTGQPLGGVRPQPRQQRVSRRGLREEALLPKCCGMEARRFPSFLPDCPDSGLALRCVSCVVSPPSSTQCSSFTPRPGEGHQPGVCCTRDVEPAHHVMRI